MNDLPTTAVLVGAVGAAFMLHKMLGSTPRPGLQGLIFGGFIGFVFGAMAGTALSLLF